MIRQDPADCEFFYFGVCIIDDKACRLRAYGVICSDFNDKEES